MESEKGKTIILTSSLDNQICLALWTIFLVFEQAGRNILRPTFRRTVRSLIYIVIYSCYLHVKLYYHVITFAECYDGGYYAIGFDAQ